MRYSHRLLTGLILAQLVFSLSVRAASVPPAGRTVILISLDGFRWDYLEKFNPPNLNRLAKEGVRAERLISMFPSLTFPNHYSIVTGLWPEHHGIIANGFYDPAYHTNYSAFNSSSAASHWWGGEPIWVTAVKQGRRADCMFWPGSNVKIEDTLPTEWRPYDKKFSATDRVDTVLGWLASANPRPAIVTLYFEGTDTAGHHTGTSSPDMVKAVKEVDDAIGRLTDGIHQQKLDDSVNLIIVSDHGMTDLSTNRLIVLSDFVNLDKVQVDFAGAIAGLRPLDGNTNALYKSFKSHQMHFHTYLSSETPKRFHFRDNESIPPVILVADPGWFLNKHELTEETAARFEKATHGYDPQVKDMGATFIACGPAFRQGVTLAPFENIHIYNLLCATLGLKPAPNDGDDRLVKKVLAK